MEDKQVRIGILSIAFTIVVASMMGGGYFNILDSMVGISLLLLIRIVPYQDISNPEIKALSSVFGLAWVLILGVVVDVCVKNNVIAYFHVKLPHTIFTTDPSDPLYIGTFILAAIWLFVSLYKMVTLRSFTVINEDP